MPKYTLENLARVPKTLEDSVRRTRAEIRQLGKSGLRISNPILGGAHIGNSRWLPWTLNRDQVRIRLVSRPCGWATPWRDCGVGFASES
jgi:hypothetical protein